MQSSRELSTFPIAPVHKSKLSYAGFLTVEDLRDVKPSELSKESGIGLEDCLEIITLVHGGTNSTDKTRAPKAVPALDMLQEEQSLPCIVTFSEKIDSMLGGGVPLCKITEFCGAPGIGKTQMCMQLAVDTQIPECFGGLAGEVIYIDTEGSFIVERLEDIAMATVQHCKEMADSEENEDLSSFTAENVLSHIHYYRCHDYIELLATINLIPDFIKTHPKVKLIIVDSIAFHFRHDFDDLSLRTRILTMTAQNLIRLATEHKLAVVLTNQMTTRFAHGEDSRLVPALGESWGHASTIRVILYWEGDQRYAWLYKSPSKQETIVPYQVTMAGIRDILEPSAPVSDHQHIITEQDDQPPKRQRTG